jgi:hypothetical protein
MWKTWERCTEMHLQEFVTRRYVCNHAGLPPVVDGMSGSNEYGESCDYLLLTRASWALHSMAALKEDE